MLVMNKNLKIGIIGGDMRQALLAAKLAEMGFETAIFGNSYTDGVGSAVICRDAVGAVNKSGVVVLPLPVTHDDVYINTSSAVDGELSLSQLCDMLVDETVLVGGKIPPQIKAFTADKSIRVLDICESEKFQVGNAVLTAEAAIEIALKELSISLFGAEVVVCGYGRIGKMLCRILSGFGARVTVSARREEDLVYIKTFGYEAVAFDGAEYRESLKKSDVIFNTVPALIVQKSDIELLKSSCFIIDLASGMGGVDFAAAKERGINAIHALGLPGKSAPDSAAMIVCECVAEMLCREGVIQN